MDQTQRPRYVSRFEPLALHPRLHHREGFPIHYLVHRGLPPREPPPRRICTTRSTELLSQTPPHNRGVGPQPNNNQHLYRRGLHTPTPPLTRGSKQQPTPPHQEGANQSPDQPLPKRDTTKARVFTTSGFFQPQTISLSSFPQNKILIDQDRR